MRYDAPAVVARFEVRAELGNAISGTIQPAWRRGQVRRERARYEAPAIASRFELRAELGIDISAVRQPAWRTPEQGRSAEHTEE